MELRISYYNTTDRHIAFKSVFSQEEFENLEMFLVKQVYLYTFAFQNIDFKNNVVYIALLDRRGEHYLELKKL